MRISDWSSDVCSSDLQRVGGGVRVDRAIISGGVRRIGGEPVGEAVPIVGIGAEIGVGDANRPQACGVAQLVRRGGPGPIQDTTERGGSFRNELQIGKEAWGERVGSNGLI